MQIQIKASTKKNCLKLLIDDQPQYEIDARLFGKTPSLPICDSPESFHEKFLEIEYKKAYQYALKRLSLKSSPGHELKKALKARFISEGSIQRVIDECKRLGYLNDNDWYRRYAESLISRRYGPQIVLMKLQLKGLAEKQASQLVEQLFSETDQTSQISQLLKTKYRLRDLKQHRERQKVIASLHRKGFELSKILEVLNN